MTGFLLSRVAQAIVSLFVVTIVIFGINHLVGDPVNAMVPAHTSVEMRATLRAELGLDRPFLVQYWDFLSGAVTGDLGDSLSRQVPVAQMIRERLPATLELAVATTIVTLAVGIPLGLVAGYRRGTLMDDGARTFSVLGQSAPTFWVGILLVLGLSVNLGLFPTGGRGSLLHLVLPTITLAWHTVAGVTRLMRSSALETLESDYIKFARIKGLSERVVLTKHVFRNASLPVLTFGGVMAANALTGSVVTESVFVWPGIGRLLIDAINSRDYPVVQGTVLFFAAGYVIVALLIDLMYLYLNPRLRAEATS